MKKEKTIRFEKGRIGIAICETIQRLSDRDREIVRLKSDLEDAEIKAKLCGRFADVSDAENVKLRKQVKKLQEIIADLRDSAENASYTELRPFVAKYQRIPGTNTHDSHASHDKWKGAEAAQSYFCGLIRKALSAAKKVKP